MNDNTFGYSEAAKYLVILLNEIENNKHRRNAQKLVSSNLSEYSEGVKEIKKIENIRVKERIARAWLHYFEKHINTVESKYLTPTIRSVVINLIQVRYRDSFIRVKKGYLKKIRKGFVRDDKISPVIKNLLRKSI